MKPRLQTSLGQHLVLTPQLRQAIHLLQLSALELDAELAAAVESNPLLDWAEPEPLPSVEPEGERATDAAPDGDSDAFPADDLPPWTRGEEPWQQRLGPVSDEDDGEAAERAVETESLQDRKSTRLNSR